MQVTSEAAFRKTIKEQNSNDQGLKQTNTKIYESNKINTKK